LNSKTIDPQSDDTHLLKIGYLINNSRQYYVSHLSKINKLLCTTSTGSLQILCSFSVQPKITLLQAIPKPHKYQTYNAFQNHTNIKTCNAFQHHKNIKTCNVFQNNSNYNYCNAFQNHTDGGLGVAQW